MNATFYKNFLRPLLFQLDPESAHHTIHGLLRDHAYLVNLVSGPLTYGGGDLACELFGKKLSNPIGLAAGFDKNGELVEAVHRLGFGFAEIGSVTALPKAGNARPRIFRLEKDQALINRLGLNSKGADAVAKLLEAHRFSIPTGINIAKTNDPAIVGDAAIKDFVYTFDKVKDLPISYVAINVSCPNTEEGIVTESAQMRSVFAEIEKLNHRNIPILLKLSPDSTLELVKEMIDAASSYQVSGFICGNTTTERVNLHTAPLEVKAHGMGGLSGPPLKEKALKLCALVYSIKKRSQVIIGCGGIASGLDAFEFIQLGASFVQIYTGLVYEGPTLPLKINCELSKILQEKKLRLSEAIGLGHRLADNKDDARDSLTSTRGDL